MDISKSKRYIEGLIFITLVIVPFVFIPIGEYNDFFYLPKVYALTIIAVFYLAILFKNRKQIPQFIQFDFINKTLLIYTLFLVISLFFARDFDFAFYGRPLREEGFITIMIYFLLFLAARSVKLPSEKVMKWISISGVILSIYAIFQFYGIDPFPRDFIRISYPRWAFSTFGNPNFLGTYLVLIIPIAMHQFIENKKNSYGLVFGVLIYTLLCTITSGAWIGASVGIITYLLIRFKNSPLSTQAFKRVIYLFTIALAMLICFNFSSGNTFIKEFKTTTGDAKKLVSNDKNAGKAGNFRIYIWKGVIELIKEKPLTGYGIENLQEPFVEKFEKDMKEKLNLVLMVDKAHNEYLHIAVSTGIPSLIVYIVFITLVLKQGKRQVKDNKAYYPIYSAIVGYLIQALFNISIVSVAYIFWIFMGLLVRYNSDKQLLNKDTYKLGESK